MNNNHQSEEKSTRERIFEFLVRYKSEYDGSTPSSREIAAACCVSPSTVSYHLLKLETENRIHLSGERKRNIEIVGANWAYETPGEAQDTSNPSEEENPGEHSQPKGSSEHQTSSHTRRR